ncbi:type VII secretion protein EccCa [Actinomadura verrucosospora]|uniref:Cell division FtsK/SpoIIIE n=1 Tax=Actinomadura verrucosospora TaxID=46165 RepID=A0A7D4A4Q4_ACTVE|nr:type VII secretion protein EccCa [Actinomadura verrucosospora]QKG22445.1 cell division FtsK/SpoIIIE [Actinomadura verrucosospora]
MATRRDTAVGIVVVRRPERRPPPRLPEGEIVLEPPPEIPETISQGFANALMYLPMAASGGAMGLMFMGGAGGAGGGNPIMWVASGLFVLSMVGMGFGHMGQGAGERKQRLNGARRDYYRYLDQMRARVRKAAKQQREALEWSGPSPRTLWSLAMSHRLWERRPSDEDFGQVRVGRGRQRLALELVTPETKPIEDLEPMCAGALRRFVRAHATVPDLPVAVSLPAFARIMVTGDPIAARAMARALVAQLVTFHTPDDVRLTICASPERMRQWQWAKWLPHCLHPTEHDAAGPVRLTGHSLADLEALLEDDLKDRPRFSPGVDTQDLPFHVVVVDDGIVPADSQMGADGIKGVCVIDLSGSVAPTSDATMLRLHVTHDGMQMMERDHTGKDVSSPLGKADSFTPVQAEGLALRLAPLRAGAADEPEQNALASNLTLTSLLGLAGPYGIDVRSTWQPRAQRNRLRVPIGVDSDGRTVELDIKESAQDGMGPHGLLIGATGSGKSELLRTLVLALAITHSSETLNFVLVDFKGGATFLGLERLQHVSAVITNLEEELPLVDRMYDALQGEMIRRQELLRSAGNYASLRDYERAREQGAQLAPMPTLFVVLDEFSELLAAKPEFAELFVMIGRLGRSLGVHLLLASQRLEEGKLRGLDSHLSYRIGLRTFSAMESRVVLGVPDAYELPSQPGNGYLKVDVSDMVRFKAAYVSGPVEEEERTQAAAAGTGTPRQIIPYSTAYVPSQSPQRHAPEEPDAGQETGETLFKAVIDQLAGQGPEAHRIWLPPLDVPPTVDQLLPPLSPTREHGLTAAGWEGRGRLAAVVGIVDRPFDQQRVPFWVDLSAAAGHVGIAGAPQTGKSTMLRSLITSLSLLHTPEEVQFYCLDFGGGTLGGLSGLPHVGGVSNRLNADRVRRTVAEVSTLLERREREFAERGIDTIATYRRLRAAGQIPGDGFGDVFLVVDGWMTLRQEYEHLEEVITDMAARGLGFGVHVVATAGKWSEFRMGIRDVFGTRLELRLGDSYESEIDRRLAENVPEGRPGRGLTRDRLHFLAALPRLDGSGDAADLGDGVAKMVEAVAGAWQGPQAPPVRLLPDLLPATALREALGDAETPKWRVPVGIDEDALAPVLLDFAADPHFVVVGDTECGKSNLLKLIAEGIVAGHGPDEARLIFIDYRRALLDTADTDHRVGYAASASAATELMTDLVDALNDRLPPADLTAEQLRKRSWWKGSDVFVVVDDYDLVATANNPLLPLLDLLPQARDIGLHLVLSRTMGGMGRALYDPVIQQLKDLAAPALIMSGSKEEGALFGEVRPTPLPVGRGTLTDRRNGARLVQTAALDD